MSSREIEILRDEIKLLNDQVKALSEQMKPMVETYQTFDKLGSWGKYFLVMIATLIGAIWTTLQIIKYFKKVG